MALTALTGPGPLFPSWQNLGISNQGNNFPVALIGNSSNQAIDAVGEIAAMIGRIYIHGRPTGTKTLSSAGGKIHFLSGTVTWATAGTTVRIGVQDVDATTGGPFRPDGTFDVFDDIVQGTDTLTSSTWTTVTMSSGTKSIAHGDLIAVTAEMTVRNGADLFRFTSLVTTVGNLPGSAAFQGGAWNTTATPGYLPIVVIEFDDGTLATLDFSLPIVAAPSEGWVDATNPDERGLIFRVEDTVKADAIWYMEAPQNAAGDFDLTVYSDPLGTPTSMYTVSILAEHSPQLAGTKAGLVNHTIAAGSEIEFAANTDYCIALKATSTGQLNLGYLEFASATYRRFISNGEQLRKGTRNNSTGAFAATTTLIPCIGIRISHEDRGGGGLLAHPGMRGGLI